MEDQQKVWDAIAPEWHEYKQLPAQHTVEFLKKQTGKILDWGSGSGRHLMRIKDSEMYFVDFSSEMIELAKQKAKNQKIKSEFAVADMAKLPYEDNFFDAAISISALHCLPKSKHKTAIKELHRVLKPGAQAFIGIWNKDSKRFKRVKGSEKEIGWTDKGKRYYYLFTEDEIHNLFKQQGLDVVDRMNSELMIRFVVEKV